LFTAIYKHTGKKSISNAAAFNFDDFGSRNFGAAPEADAAGFCDLIGRVEPAAAALPSPNISTISFPDDSRVEILFLMSRSSEGIDEV
jgi:hypothetical protein